MLQERRYGMILRILCVDVMTATLNSGLLHVRQRTMPNFEHMLLGSDFSSASLKIS